jgi:hypothetical protein
MLCHRFQPWPRDALLSVGRKFLTKLQKESGKRT